MVCFLLGVDVGGIDEFVEVDGRVWYVRICFLVNVVNVLKKDKMIWGI